MDIPRHTGSLNAARRRSVEQISGLYPLLRRLPDPGHITGRQDLNVGKTCRRYKPGDGAFGQNGQGRANRNTRAACAYAEWRTKIDGFLVARSGIGNRCGCDAAIRQHVVLARDAGE
jgi:hypothetical protein